MTPLGSPHCKASFHISVTIGHWMVHDCPGENLCCSNNSQLLLLWLGTEQNCKAENWLDYCCIITVEKLWLLLILFSLPGRNVLYDLMSEWELN